MLKAVKFGGWESLVLARWYLDVVYTADLVILIYLGSRYSSGRCTKSSDPGDLGRYITGFD